MGQQLGLVRFDHESVGSGSTGHDRGDKQEAIDREKWRNWDFFGMGFFSWFSSIVWKMRFGDGVELLEGKERALGDLGSRSLESFLCGRRGG